MAEVVVGGARARAFYVKRQAKGKFNQNFHLQFFGSVPLVYDVIVVVVFVDIQVWKESSVTRLGNFLDFGQIIKAFGNNKFAQISHILRQFL